MGGVSAQCTAVMCEQFDRNIIIIITSLQSYLKQADKDEEHEEKRRRKEQAIEQNLSEDIFGLRCEVVSKCDFLHIV